MFSITSHRTYPIPCQHLRKSGRLASYTYSCVFCRAVSYQPYGPADTLISSADGVTSSGLSALEAREVWGSGFKGTMEQRPVFIRELVPECPVVPTERVSVLLRTAFTLRDCGKMQVVCLSVRYVA